MSAASGSGPTFLPYVGAAILLASVAPASTPAAWDAFQDEVLKACVGASSLRQAQAAGQRIDYDDRIGFSALLLAGQYPQPHLRNRSGRELCLFDRRTRTATTADADQILSTH